MSPAISKTIGIPFASPPEGETDREARGLPS